MDRQVITAIAFDRGDQQKYYEVLNKAKGLADVIKIGPSTLLKLGFDCIKEAKNKGFEVFLDLKFHDIPYQVEGAIREAGKAGVSFVTIHTSGGPDMIKAAVDAAANYDIKILGVTVLTSLRIEVAEKIYGSEYDKKIKQLIEMGVNQGLHGIVAPGNMLENIRQEYKELLVAVPGIRFNSFLDDDQAQTSDPFKIVDKEPIMLIFGRAVTKDPSGWEKLGRFKLWVQEKMKV